MATMYRSMDKAMLGVLTNEPQTVVQVQKALKAKEINLAQSTISYALSRLARSQQCVQEKEERLGKMAKVFKAKEIEIPAA